MYDIITSIYAKEPAVRVIRPTEKIRAGGTPQCCLNRTS